jgi:hypothetical protein
MGHGRWLGLNTRAALRIPTWNEVLRSTRRGLASSGNRRQRHGANGERTWPPTRWCSWVGGGTPERKSWTWQQGEINLQGTARSKPSRARETLRTELR